ncbi:MAG: hypothetical protein AB2693_11445 [Candidatus Thiodiazotropha sp.]
MSDKTANLYIPDFRAWEDFYERRAAKKDSKVGFSIETESDAVKQQFQQQLVVQPERLQDCERSANDPKIIKVVSPTEQTVQQAASVMKKAGIKVKQKRKSCAKGHNSNSKNNRSKKAPKKQQKRKDKRAAFSYRTLSDIFTKRR